MFTCLIARAQRLDDSWLISAPNKLGIPEADLRHYATNGDLSLTSLIHLTRHQFSQMGELSWRYHRFSAILFEASEFNVQDTSPNLQHEFCALWNQIVLRSQNDHDLPMVLFILRPIRNVFVALHQGTDPSPAQFSSSTGYLNDVLRDPSSYPPCDIVSHIHNSASTTLARAVLHDDDDAPLPPSLASPDVPSSPLPASPHVVESLTNIPLDDLHPRATHKTTTESLSIPFTSRDAATADAFVTSGMIIPCPTSATPTSAPPLSSASPPVAVALQRNPDLLAPSDPPNHPSSASYPILDNTDPTAFTECHHSAVFPVAPSASTGPASVPDPGVAAKDDGSLRPVPCEGRDIHPDHPLAIRAIPANTMATLDLPPPSPSLLSVNDMDPVTAGPLLREPNTERTGDLPPNPLHYPYDIV
ncbi:hypothetical protein EDB84DRAFT_53136 [Lactarius hengduanensis]|nr:hypothetical protein EDB84DRAFT_53136 [Lactarius hengduanensis]